MEKKNAIVLTDGLLMTSDAKTAHGLIRGTERFHIIGLVDGEANAGKDAGVLLDGKRRDIPVFATMEAAIDALDIDGTVTSVKTHDEISKVDGLVIPGGESTTIGQLSAANGSLKMLKEKIEFRPIPYDIQRQLRFNQKLKFEKTYSYIYDENGTLEKKYGFNPINPKLISMSSNRFISKAVEERTQRKNFYESYYETGEIKEKKYFSKYGKPLLLKTFNKNGRVIRERRP